MAKNISPQDKLDALEKKIEGFFSNLRKVQFDLWAAFHEAEQTGAWTTYGPSFDGYLRGRWNLTAVQVAHYDLYKEAVAAVPHKRLASSGSPHAVLQIVETARRQEDPISCIRKTFETVHGDLVSFQERHNRIPSRQQQREIARKAAKAVGFNHENKTKSRSTSKTEVLEQRIAELTRVLEAISMTSSDPQIRKLATDAVRGTVTAPTDGAAQEATIN